MGKPSPAKIIPAPTKSGSEKCGCSCFLEACLYFLAYLTSLGFTTVWVFRHLAWSDCEITFCVVSLILNHLLIKVAKRTARDGDILFWIDPCNIQRVLQKGVNKILGNDKQDRSQALEAALRNNRKVRLFGRGNPKDNERSILTGYSLLLLFYLACHIEVENNVPMQRGDVDVGVCTSL